MAADGQVAAGRIGWAAATANAVPMVVLWCLAVATVAAYEIQGTGPSNSACDQGTRS